MKQKHEHRTEEYRNVDRLVFKGKPRSLSGHGRSRSFQAPNLILSTEHISIVVHWPFLSRTQRPFPSVVSSAISVPLRYYPIAGMVIAKASSRWTSRLFAQSVRATKSSRTWRPAQRRTYATEGNHSSQKSSMLSGDLPWYAHVHSDSA